MLHKTQFHFQKHQTTTQAAELKMKQMTEEFNCQISTLKQESEERINHMKAAMQTESEIKTENIIQHFDKVINGIFDDHQQETGLMKDDMEEKILGMDQVLYCLD